jgi:hypothetical protein
VTLTPRHSEAAFEIVIEVHLLQNGYWWRRERARIAGPVSRDRFVREREKYVAGNGEISPYSPVAVWWLGQRLARMA